MSFFSELFGNSKYKNINEDELNKISKENKDALIIDVRSVGEFRNGHIPKAKNIPVQELSSKIHTLDAYKNTDIILYCASGTRSSSAAKLLSNNGFNHIYNLSGGISKYKGQLK